MRPLAALLALLCLARAGGTAGAEAPLRAEFWAPLEASPWEAAAGSAEEAEARAAEALLAEAAFVFGGIFEGFEFEWEPRDPARGRPERFSLLPLAELRPGDPRLRPEAPVARGGLLRAYVEFRPDAQDERAREVQSGPSWFSAQGRGRAALDAGGGKLAAYEEALRAGLEAALRERLPNRPRLVRGRAAFAAPPSVGLAEGGWLVSARLRLEIVEALGYGP